MTRKVRAGKHNPEEKGKLASTGHVRKELFCVSLAPAVMYAHGRPPTFAVSLRACVLCGEDDEAIFLSVLSR